LTIAIVKTQVKSSVYIAFQFSKGDFLAGVFLTGVQILTIKKPTLFRVGS
jgi:hypothetical protein